jgi:phage/plasmid-like protein (TIGR03299 family)
MAYFGEVPWHGLGTQLSSPATAAEAIKAGSLDWAVEKTPLYFSDKSEVPDAVGIHRSDTKQFFGTVSKQFTPVQNSEAFEFFDHVVGTKAAIYHTVGALDDGRRIWLLAKLSGDFSPVKNDPVEKFLLLANCHNGTMALRMLFTPVRVVCHNTLSLALSNVDEGISIRHKGDLSEKIKEAQRVLGIAVKHYEQIADFCKLLATKKIGKDDEGIIAARVLPDVAVEEKEGQPDRIVEGRKEIIRLMHEGRGNSVVEGTAWASYNGVTEYADHDGIHAGISTERRLGRLNQIWFGTRLAMKRRGLEAIKELLHV